MASYHSSASWRCIRSHTQSKCNMKDSIPYASIHIVEGCPTRGRLPGGPTRGAHQGCSCACVGPGCTEIDVFVWSSHAIGVSTHLQLSLSVPSLLQSRRGARRQQEVWHSGKTRSDPASFIATCAPKLLDRWCMWIYDGYSSPIVVEGRILRVGGFVGRCRFLKDSAG